MSLPATIDAVQTRTRQFAKRQGTWFRGLAEVTPWPITETLAAETIATNLEEVIGQSRGCLPSGKGEICHR